MGDCLAERTHALDEALDLLALEQLPAVLLYPPLGPLVGVEPARGTFALAQRLLDVSVESLPVERPRSDDGLEHVVIVLAVGTDGPDELRPLVRDPGQRREPRAHVRGSFRVVREGREQRARPSRGLALVERLHRESEAAWIAADLVQRQQPGVAVEGRVLDALGHHRASRLLETRDELVVTALLEQEHPRERSRDA
jgi:hypothetical protein